MGHFVEAFVTIVLAVIGLAIVSVLVSNRANTTGVIQAGASGLGNVLGEAISPVTGSGAQLSLGYPAATNSGYGFGSGIG